VAINCLSVIMGRNVANTRAVVKSFIVAKYFTPDAREGW
jgi:hypothetical protein